MALCEQNGDRLGQARALQNLGITRREQGRLAQAADYQHQALALFDELGDRIGQSATVKELGVIELRSGRHPQAIEHLEHASAAVPKDQRATSGNRHTQRSR
jgi:tetratricopeptide (TPR) repeat protein